MRTLIKNVKLPEAYGFGTDSVTVEVCDRVFGAVGRVAREAEIAYDTVIDGKGKL